MKSILLASAKRMCSILIAATLLIVIALAANGAFNLTAAVFVGYAVGAIWVATLAYRTWMSTGHSASGAKRIMLWGLALRLAILFSVLFTAIHISVGVFSAVVAGFLLFYALAMISLARELHGNR